MVCVQLFNALRAHAAAMRKAGRPMSPPAVLRRRRAPLFLSLAVWLVLRNSGTFVPGPGRHPGADERGAPRLHHHAAAAGAGGRDPPPWAAAAAAAASLAAGPHPAAAADAGGGGDWFQPFVNVNAQVIEGIDNVVGSAGVAIILYTVLIKVVTYPVTSQALRTNAILQLITPQMKEIEKRYGDDEDKKNDLLRRLFAEVNLNPLSGLLPVFVQLPIFLALFRAIGQLAAQDEHFKERFLWIPSLSGPVPSGNPSLDWLWKSRFADHFEPLVGWDDATGYLILPVLVVISQFFANNLTGVKGGQADWINGALPWFVGISCMVSPSGLGIYWVVNNMLTTGQMLLVKSQVNAELPKYKEASDMYEEAEAASGGIRYTRPSPFQESDAAARGKPTSAAEPEEEAPRPITRRMRRSKKGGNMRKGWSD